MPCAGDKRPACLREVVTCSCVHSCRAADAVPNGHRAGHAAPATAPHAAQPPAAATPGALNVCNLLSAPGPALCCGSRLRLSRPDPCRPRLHPLACSLVAAGCSGVLAAGQARPRTSAGSCCVTTPPAEPLLSAVKQRPSASADAAQAAAVPKPPHITFFVLCASASRLFVICSGIVRDSTAVVLAGAR